MKDEFSIARKVASSAGCVFLQIDNHDLGFLTIRLLPKLTLDESVQSVGAYFSITGNAACVVNAGSRPRGLNSSEVFALFEGLVKSLITISESFKDADVLYGTLSSTHTVGNSEAVVEVKSVYNAEGGLTGADISFKMQHSKNDIYQSFTIRIDAENNDQIRESVFKFAKALLTALDSLRERPMMDSEKVKDKLTQIKSDIKPSAPKTPWYRRIFSF